MDSDDSDNELIKEIIEEEKQNKTIPQDNEMYTIDSFNED